MRGRTAVVVLVTAGLTGLLGGCGEGGVTLPTQRPSITLPTGSGTASATDTPTDTAAPTDTASPTSAPTDTAATPTETATVTVTPTPTPTATPSPSPTASGEAEGATDEGGGISPWWFVLVGLVLLAAILWWALARSRSRREAQAALLAGLEQRGRWVVDHGVGGLIGAGDPGATQEAWSRLNATLVDMAGRVRTLAHEIPADQGAPVMALRDAVAGVQGAAEAHARARLTGEPSPATAEALFAARDRLAQALDGLAATPR